MFDTFMDIVKGGKASISSAVSKPRKVCANFISQTTTNINTHKLIQLPFQIMFSLQLSMLYLLMLHYNNIDLAKPKSGAPDFITIINF